MVSSGKTSWLGITVVIFLTGIALYFINSAFAQPYVEWKNYNEVHSAEIQKMLTE
ncbi:MAG: hypothetical protein WC768_04715 [Patescibacteria group bacterium]|jgi:hypothetical protein